MYIRELKQMDEKKLLKKVEKCKEVFRIARKYKLSEYLIEEIAEHIRITQRTDGWHDWGYNLGVWWRNVAWYQPLTEEFIEEKIHLFHWNSISCNQYLTDSFIDKHSSQLNWHYLCRYVPLSENIIEKYAHKVDWKELFAHQELKEDFIIKYQDKISWNFLMQNPHLSRDFFENNKHLLTVKLYATDLVKIIERQNLSEETLREIKKGKMAWGAISQSATLTRDFVIQNYDKIDTWKVMRNFNTNREIRKEVEMIEKLSGN